MSIPTNIHIFYNDVILSKTEVNCQSHQLKKKKIKVSVEEDNIRTTLS